MFVLSRNGPMKGAQEQHRQRLDRHHLAQGGSATGDLQDEERLSQKLKPRPDVRDRLADEEPTVVRIREGSRLPTVDHGGSMKTDLLEKLHAYTQLM